MTQQATPHPTATRRPLQFTIGFLLLLTAYCAFWTCAGRLVTRRIEGRNATAEAANAAFQATLCHLQVPECARKVDYYAHFQGGTASFDVPETQFLEWAANYPWKLSEVNLSGKTPASWELR